MTNAAAFLKTDLAVLVATRGILVFSREGWESVWKLDNLAVSYNTGPSLTESVVAKIKLDITRSSTPLLNIPWHGSSMDKRLTRAEPWNSQSSVNWIIKSRRVLLREPRVIASNVFTSFHGSMRVRVYP